MTIHRSGDPETQENSDRLRSAGHKAKASRLSVRGHLTGCGNEGDRQELTLS